MFLLLLYSKKTPSFQGRNGQPPPNPPGHPNNKNNKNSSFFKIPLNTIDLPPAFQIKGKAELLR
jgi:hypothetical protein